MFRFLWHIIWMMCCLSSDWDYTNCHEWHVDYPYCGGDTQSPINIDYNSVDLKCPVTLENGHEALVWSIVDLKRTYQIENDGHALEMVPHDFFWREEERNGVSEYPIATLRNNFVTDSGEHSNFCLGTIHIHYGSKSDFGSEHTMNGERAPMEMHFVHYSCDYKSMEEAMDDENVKDKYVLAVVAVLFEVGEYNQYFEHITEQIDYVMNPGDTMIITNADLSDLVPLTSTDFFYYEGSLTTPGCDPIVRWHILSDRWSISEEQLEVLRSLHGDDHFEADHLDNNYRPIQKNINRVFYCTSNKDVTLPGIKSDESDKSDALSVKLREDLKKDDFQYMSTMNILIVGFFIAFLCLGIGLFIGCGTCTFPQSSQKKKIQIDDVWFNSNNPNLKHLYDTNDI